MVQVKMYFRLVSYSISAVKHLKYPCSLVPLAILSYNYVMCELYHTWDIALKAKADGKGVITISELCLSFYSHPNISDGKFLLVPHLFQISFSQPK